MKKNKALILVALFFVGTMLYVFGNMYLSNLHQGGGSSSSNATSDDSGAGSGGKNGDTSPGKNSSGGDAGGSANQAPNPTQAAQTNPLENFFQSNNNVPAPTAPIGATTNSNSAGAAGQTTTQGNTQNNGAMNQSQAIPTTMPGIQ